MGHVHNAIDRATDLIRGYRRALGILSPDGGLERFGETLTPTIDLWSDPRWASLMGDKLQFGVATAAANAGFRSQVQLGPQPPGKYCIIVWRIQCGAAFDVRTQFPGAALPTAITATRGGRDSRQTADLRALLATDNTTAAVGNLRWSLGVTPFIYEEPIILHTGDGVNAAKVVVTAQADNTAITANFSWTVHDFFPGEDSER